MHACRSTLEDPTFADGSGITLGRGVGAAVTRMDHQVTFTAGLPDPKYPDNGRALLTQNPAAIWVNAAGERFVNESGPSKVADAAILAMRPATHWLIYDRNGVKSLRVRDAVWLSNPDGQATLAAAPHIRKAENLTDLAISAGLRPAALERTVARWNAALAAGEDTEFGRFGPGRKDPEAVAILEPPFYAIQLFPLTRKSMGGLAIDERTRVLADGGSVIPAFYAAGEVTGVAGINGSYGGEGTFLGPSVWQGRISGREAAASALARYATPETAAPVRRVAAAAAPAAGPAVTLTVEGLDQLIGTTRPGYWHFEVVHRTVRARNLDCTACHSPAWPTRAPATGAEWQAQLASCATCH